MPIPTDDELRTHCRFMVRSMAKGSLIPFLGAGANLTNRPDGQPFALRQYLPSAEELSVEIATNFDYQWERGMRPVNLPRVSWYVFKKYGPGFLYEYLYDIFNIDYPVTDAHRFFAMLPKKLRHKGYPERNHLIITTNYDDLLERAFIAAKEKFDVLSYIANFYVKDTDKDQIDMRNASKFRHKPHGGEPMIVKEPNKFLPAPEHTTILKIHGTVDRSVDGSGLETSSFVITEDDYLDYLSHMNSDEMYKIPSSVVAMMSKKRFLFLGYSLGDWNLRVLIKRVNESRRFKDQSWAIMKTPKEWDPDYWNHHNVYLYEVALDKYVSMLEEQLDALPEYREVA